MLRNRSALHRRAPLGDGPRGRCPIHSLRVDLSDEDLLAFLDYPAGHRPPERVHALFPSVLAEARDLVDARGILRSIPIEDAPRILLDPRPADALVIGLVSIGGAVEERVTRYAREGEAARAMLLDAAGSAAVEQAADRISAAAASGRLAGPDPIEPTDFGHVPCRWSPGYGRWPIVAQVELCRRLPHEEIGVRLLPTMLMSPRKSISFALWFGGDALATIDGAGCARCALVRCRYRKEDRIVPDHSPR